MLDPTSQSAPPPPPSASPSGTSTTRARFGHRFTNVIRRHPLGTVVVTGLALAVYFQKQAEEQARQDAKKKKVLVIPFYKMKLVEERKNGVSQLVSAAATENQGASSSMEEMEVHELVRLIHRAAADPGIVALYGIFGHGFRFEVGGWAHVEEVRNALQVFRESHRVHREPNLSHEPILKRHGNGTPKPMYAYADSFASPMSASSMKEFYLASAFTHIQLQPQGALNLYGLHATNAFYKNALQKYGVQVHVFKHGLYKNFANQFTESHYTREHRENVKTILDGINQHLCNGIYHARGQLSALVQFSQFWAMAHNAGTFSADMAQKLGFVDYLPRLDPLDQLVASNKSEQAKKEMKDKWGNETDLDLFQAEESISISDYANQVRKQISNENSQWKVFQRMKTISEDSATMRILFSTLGYKGPNFNMNPSDFVEEKANGLKETIAVIRLNGLITDKMARTTEQMLKEVKKDKSVKCVVLRVDSQGGEITACETIHQQIKDLPQKVVVSFGNVSASGGYYISSSADRIFASPTTVTGSIGVFMMKIDLRGLAAQYGITFDSVATSELSGTSDPFYPINARMKENFANGADRAYKHFKTLVANGRHMDLDAVEDVAAGRVWTGVHAKELGLVDQLGGLDRAIAYAQRNYTESGQAKVSLWKPPTPSIWEKIKSAAKNQTMSFWQFSLDGDKNHGLGGTDIIRSNEFLFGGMAFPIAASGIMLTFDENSAVECLLKNSDAQKFLSTRNSKQLW